MPVGSCLGDGFSPSTPSFSSNGSNPLDIIVTSSVLNTADQFAFMQQTLLMQIFRSPPNTNHSSSSSSSSPTSGINGCGNLNGAWNGNGRSSSRSSGSGESASMNATFMCPTCVAFSDHCCQQESGMQIFHEFLEANLVNYWDAKLTEALASLR